ncbi:protein Tat [Leptospira ellinghausenii]|uniref:Protein Tat n=1 Tax=Leptospira ellinghausenii TaxID=1917822 RepID=A0A2P2DD58_9LEPT|nr:protein Tat [Leptospira ellinghausenii]
MVHQYRGVLYKSASDSLKNSSFTKKQFISHAKLVGIPTENGKDLETRIRTDPSKTCLLMKHSL